MKLGNWVVPDGEKYRWYWMGKSPSVRLAVEDYLMLKGKVSKEECARHNNITSTAIRNNLRKMKEQKIIQKPYVHPSTANNGGVRTDE